MVLLQHHHLSYTRKRVIREINSLLYKYKNINTYFWKMETIKNSLFLISTQLNLSGMQQLCQTVPLKLQVAQMFQAWQKETTDYRAQFKNKYLHHHSLLCE